ncbi:peptide/nickel transport system ATP-binding protein [Paenibacillus sp. UNC496MF]|uniref:ABC transporter ATP-binding protein n=1 Tax=Paenibacillus sp. UNC496MF TaxID=1502753 RepID=UPI0008F43715|nr:ABC transporter ATP-binding protein [Paenibacillus sp. UNC496MF]SFJ17281.1 peptide/nickel transport system ATP-binding protein [Paenibacillus sp. UNC496MF]
MNTIDLEYERDTRQRFREETRPVSPEALMRLDNVSLYYERNQGMFAAPQKIGAVVNVSLNIHPGEIIALVGESGCGKTTLGSIMTGLLKPTTGKLLYKGEDVDKLSGDKMTDFRSGVQLVQQDSYAALNPMRTIYQSLSSPILQRKIVKGRKAARARVIELLQTVGLTPPERFLDKYPHQLSGGQRQRILMARAISLNPKIIVADEPVSMIDVSLRISILNMMAELNRKLDIAIIYITHDLATARYIAGRGRMAVMYLGRVMELGGVDEVLSHPKHPYLQALLSAVPTPDPEIAKAMTELPLRSLEMPSAARPPSGCRFHPRCPMATDKCTTEEPQLRRVGSEEAACHYAEEAHDHWQRKMADIGVFKST